MIAVLFFGMTGYYSVFKLQQFTIRKEIKAQLKKSIPREQLHQIIVKDNESDKLEWEERGKEFRYMGELYDVVFSEKKAGAVYYFCLKDKEETSLFASLNLLVKKQQEGNGNLSKNPVKVFFAVCWFASEASVVFRSTEHQLQHQEWVAPFHIQQFLSSPSPPPKTA